MKKWEVWSEDSYLGEGLFIGSFADKGEARAFVKRLQKSQRAQGMEPFRYRVNSTKRRKMKHSRRRMYR